MNRSLGRVGMPLGSCVHSSSSSGGGGSSTSYLGGSSSSAYSSSSSAQRCYVDNASNRSLGRVGKPVGSHVVHRDGSTTMSSGGASYMSQSSQSRMYVDNSMNHSLGRVGKPLGSHMVHGGGYTNVSSGGASLSTASRSSRTYVDNSMNLSLGRVGKPVGSHVVHKDGTTTVSGAIRASPTSTTSSTKTYVDNEMNRMLGRVGKPLGSHVVHKDGSLSVSSSELPLGVASKKNSSEPGRKPETTRAVPKCRSLHVEPHFLPVQQHYVDNGAVPKYGSLHVEPHFLPVQQHYVDNGAVPKYGSLHVEPHFLPVQQRYVDNGAVPKDGSLHDEPHFAPVQQRYVDNGAVPKDRSLHDEPDFLPVQRRYVDNAYNRRLGRVGKPIHLRQIGRKASVDSPLEQKLLCERNLQDIVEILHNLNFTDRNYPAVVKAQDELQRTEVEESWKKSGIIPSTDCSKAVEMTKEIIPLAEISVLEKIGEGGFGKVYAAMWKDTPIAFKKLAYQQISKKKREQLVKEIRIFSKLSHDNIVKMFGVVVDAENIGIIMEYLPKTLYHAIFIEEVSFGREEKKRIIGEIIAALCYLHTPEDTLSYSKPKIAHCDVKSQNILLDVNNVAKLCDFGLSAMKNTMQSSSSRSLAIPGQGTPRYAAPEVLRGEVLTMSGLIMSDIYSLSLVIYEIFVEEEPYEDLGLLQLIENVGRGSTRPSLEDVSLTTAIKELLIKGWDRTPSCRPDIVDFSWDFFGIEEFVEDKQPIVV